MDTRERIAHLMLIVFVLGMVCMLASTIAEGQDSQSEIARTVRPTDTHAPSRVGGHSSNTTLWLARCMVGEARWQRRVDHIAIAWILHKRHVRARKRFPGLTYQQQTRAYCKSLNSDRDAWVRRLPATAAPGTPAPAGWPEKASWPRHIPRWAAVLHTASTWRQHRDPFPKAMHFGAPDIWADLAHAAAHGMVRVSGPPQTANIFYALAVKR